MMNMLEYKFFDGNYEAALDRADRIVHGEAVSDPERLRGVADFLDVMDLNRGVVTDTEIQQDLRRIADRLEEFERSGQHE
jgi:hypothetical protein